jgi:ABC-type multidrug transport system ATPase subunit
LEIISHRKSFDIIISHIKSHQIATQTYGTLYPGEVCALVGPSGAGKSTLLNILSGRQRWSGNGVKVEGRIRYGGQLMNPSNLKECIAFVMQDDAMCAFQTVSEALMFSARLKLQGAGEKECWDEVGGNLF